MSAFISLRDMNQMFERCIEAADVQYGIVQAVSDNRFKRMDITSARELIDYRPQDDSFGFRHGHSLSRSLVRGRGAAGPNEKP